MDHRPGRFVVHDTQVCKLLERLARETGVDERLPCGGLLVVRIHAHHPDNEAHGLEERSGPLRVIGKELGLLVREDVGIGAEGRELGRVEFLADRKRRSE